MAREGACREFASLLRGRHLYGKIIVDVIIKFNTVANYMPEEVETDPFREKDRRKEEGRRVRTSVLTRSLSWIFINSRLAASMRTARRSLLRFTIS